MVFRSSKYCYPLLFAALMYKACTLYHAVDSAARVLKNKFLVEATCLWQISTDSLITIASGIMLCRACLVDGRDERAASFSVQTIAMADRLDLACHYPASVTRFRNLSPADARFHAYIAWGHFAFHSKRSIAYTDPAPEYAPNCPIPGGDWTQPVAQPPYAGEMSAIMANFWTVMLPACSYYYLVRSRSFAQAQLLVIAEMVYKTLLDWSKSLDTIAASAPRSDLAFHHLANCRSSSICLHVSIMDLFRPFLGLGYNLASFSAGTVPESVFMASLTQLKQTVLTVHTTSRTEWQIPM
ncbi:hypothetical protein CLAFUW4_05254 [Fulvia fulva]|uniref:Transcription factor domain-containing protein n=1 Tax=Passalora fulva TaxID=5499 RepID=A0A9Q8P9R3_PASFU|nr:uncharacterized protein CLAFUR5_05401 [Fulvia fulva]KAK4624201.1 hypothetical protein CLAFUR4_05248 [Fulvia fulva]KAK4625411.1 hypothetical protein CLAFUR0_05254 [Fulvia fulva]UJO18332.1 hypothetical protein CLAFUR5_05401 [Fulvia fulva]WPV14720.1 hypothetical protein CLAFUW4_05254 [Fulvia fulva]WPV29964.1 hypothetical protein CLAFUW7_05253 [Fulvia fulva]